jgi:hypothetical protein
MPRKIQPKEGVLAFEESRLLFPQFSTSACPVDEKERRIFFRSPWLRFQNVKSCSVDVENQWL